MPPALREMKNYVQWIYRLGYPSIFMQLLYTVYIVALNMILAGFSGSSSVVFFQAIGSAKPSAFLSFLRQILCLIPIFWGFSKIGLQYTWLAFPIAEIVTGTVGVFLYRRKTRKWE